MLLIKKDIHNVLKDDSSLYRNLKPEFELSLCNGEECHIAEIILKTDKPQPAEMIVMFSQDGEHWKDNIKFSISAEESQKYKHR